MLRFNETLQFLIAHLNLNVFIKKIRASYFNPKIIKKLNINTIIIKYK